MSKYLPALQHQAYFCASRPVPEDSVAGLFLEGLESRRVQDNVLCKCVGSSVPTLDWIVGLAQQFEQLAITMNQFHRWLARHHQVLCLLSLQGLSMSLQLKVVAIKPWLY